jgi:hypothetical protein
MYLLQQFQIKTFYELIPSLLLKQSPLYAEHRLKISESKQRSSGATCHKPVKMVNLLLILRYVINRDTKSYITVILL